MIIKAILLSTIAASISFFISHSQLLERFRHWLFICGGAEKSPESFFEHVTYFFHELISCCYCLGYWIAVAVLVIFPVRLFGIFWPVDYLLTWLVISWVAGLQSLIASRLWGD